MAHYTSRRLRADTEAEMIAALPWARFDGGWVSSSPAYAIAIQGTRTVTPGTYDDEGAEITPPAIDGRCHAILRTTAAFAHGIEPALIVEGVEPGWWEWAE